MPKSSKSRARLSVGVSLVPEVAEYLDEIAAKLKAPRSFIINAIISKYASTTDNRHLMPLVTDQSIINF